MYVNPYSPVYFFYYFTDLFFPFFPSRLTQPCWGNMLKCFMLKNVTEECMLRHDLMMVQLPQQKKVIISMCCNLHKNLKPSFHVFIYFLFHLLCSFLRSLSFCSSLNISFVTELVDWDRTSSYLGKSISYPLGFLQPVCLLLLGLLLLCVWFVRARICIVWILLSFFFFAHVP